MIKFSREIKAGIATVVILALFYWGFSYLKGRNLLDGRLSSYYATYKDVGGLTKSSAVIINGFRVGSVVDIFFSKDPAKKGELVVEFTIEKDFEFSKNSIAKINSGGLMGGKSISVIPIYDNAELAKPGDYLKGTIGLGMLSKIDPLQHKLESTITQVDSVAASVNMLMNREMITNLQSSIASINQILTTLQGTTKSIDVIVNQNKSNLDVSIKNMSQTTANLKTISDSLAQVKILSISKKINNTVASLDKITSGIEFGEGTLGKLTKDEKLYNNLEAASKELEELLREMKEHPKRFVHFSLFGKKEKPYKSETNEN